MPKFVVYEVQEEHRTKKWCYEVEAEDCDAALEKVQNNDGGVVADPIECGEIGDPDYGDSGWAVREADVPDAADPWDEAFEDFVQQFGC